VVVSLKLHKPENRELKSDFTSLLLCENDCAELRIEWFSNPYYFSFCIGTVLPFEWIKPFADKNK